MKNLSLLLGAAVAAVAASACCIIPLLTGLASVGMLGLSAALAPYRPYLMGVTALMIGAAFYFTYRRPANACDTDGNCADTGAPGVRRFSRTVLWAVTFFTVVAVAYPQIAQYKVRRALAASDPAAPVWARTVVFSVGKMSCADCSQQIAGMLKKIPGVYTARVDFDARRATISFDPARVSMDRLRAAIEGAGYPITQAS